MGNPITDKTTTEAKYILFRPISSNHIQSHYLAVIVIFTTIYAVSTAGFNPSDSTIGAALTEENWIIRIAAVSRHGIIYLGLVISYEKLV